MIVAGLIAGLGFNEAQAGLVLTAELLLMGIAAAGLAPWMDRLNARSVSLVGAFLLLVGHGAAAGAGSMWAIVLWRSVAGLGAGTVLAAVNATIAGAPNPPRLYGLALMTSPLVATVTALIMSSRTVAVLAHSGAYGVLAVLTLIIVPILIVFPEYRTQRTVPPPGALPERGPGIVLLIAIFLFTASMMAYFPFIERLGVRLDLSLERIGEIFTIVVVAGGVGAGFAAVLETRIGVVAPLVGSLLLHSAAMILAIEVATLPAYVVGAVLEAVSFSFCVTFQFSLAAMLDRHGRWAAAAGGSLALGLGVGPYLGGALIESAGYSALSVLIVVTTIPAVAAFGWVARGRRAVMPERL